MAAKKYIEDTFEKLRILHRSEKNEIWLVMNRRDQQVYVLKCIGRIDLPYQQLSKLKHIGLPKVVYACEEAGKTYVIEEYIKGVNLACLLADQGVLPEKQVVEIALSLCGCLAFLHQHKLIHRDIKPSNIIFTDEGKVKLIDFDAARMHEEKKSGDTRTLGTEGYAPPEQYGFAQTDERSDLYSLGVTLQELLGKNYRGYLVDVIQQCMKIDPAQRVASAENLLALIKSKKSNKYKKYGSSFIVVSLIVGVCCYIYTFKNTPTEETVQIPDMKIEESMKSDTKISAEKITEPLPDKAENKELQKTDLGEKPIVSAPSKEPSTAVLNNSLLSLKKGWDFGLSEVNGFLGDSSVSDEAVKKTYPNAVFAGRAILGFWIDNPYSTKVLNPIVTLNFSDFLVDATCENFTEEVSGNNTPRQYVYSYANRDESTGLYRSVICHVTGTLDLAPHHHNVTFDLVNNIAIGSNPTVEVVVTADNIELLTKTYPLEIKRL